MKKVGIVMGSDSDLPILRKAMDTLDNLGIPYEAHVYSAHRTPEQARDFALHARENGFGAMIAAAGMAAHLAGAIAANTTIPVIGIPCKSTNLDGIDALLSTVQMPSGIPVATVAINGAVNAALLAAQIIAVSDEALAAKLDQKDYRVYTLLGDGESEEGQVWEAAMFAGHKKLDNLCVIVDYNGLQIDGPISEVAGPEPFDSKFAAFGFDVQVVDGHDFDALEKAFDHAKTVKGQPSAIICKTVKGKGVSYMENQVGWHGTAPNAEQYEVAKEELLRQLNELEAE